MGTLITTIQNHIGTNAERIAFVTTGLKAGSTWETTDTGLIYKWDGTNWFTAAKESLSLAAGTAIIGKVGIDQTTDGTTNKVRTEGVAQTRYNTTALAASGVIKASAGTIYGFSGVNESLTDQYLHIYESPTVPADGAVPVIILKIFAGSNFSFDAGDYGVGFTTGISWSNSSTVATKTIGSADCTLVATYK